MTSFPFRVFGGMGVCNGLTILLFLLANTQETNSKTIIEIHWLSQQLSLVTKCFKKHTKQVIRMLFWQKADFLHYSFEIARQGNTDTLKDAEACQVDGKSNRKGLFFSLYKLFCVKLKPFSMDYYSQIVLHLNLDHCYFNHCHHN